MMLRIYGVLQVEILGHYTFCYLRPMKIRLLTVLICLAAPLLAQVPAPQPLRLKEGLELAIANSANVEKARLDRQGLEQRLKEARNAAYPRMTANLDVDYSPVLPTQVMPGEVVGQPGTIIPVQFGRAWQAMGAIQAEQPLYNESLRRSKQAINLTRELTDLQVKRSEEEVIYNTALVFYQTLQTRQLQRSIDANLEKLSALQQVAELQLKNGYAIPTDVKRIKVARTNLEAQRQNLLNAILNLEQTLSFLCGLPLDGRVEPLEDLMNPAADSLTWKNLLLETRTTTEFKLLSRAIDLNHVQVRSSKPNPCPA
jgi:outer membrane protein